MAWCLCSSLPEGGYRVSPRPPGTTGEDVRWAHGIPHVVRLSRGRGEVGGWQHTPTGPGAASPGGGAPCGTLESSRVHARFFFQKAASVHGW